MFFKKREEIDPNIIKLIYKNSRVSRYIEFIFGILLIAISYNVFVLSMNIVYGMGGVGVILKNIYNIDPAVTILIGDLILLIFSLIFLGREQTSKTVCGTILYPVFIKATEFITSYIDISNLEPIVLVVFGAVVTGIGLGLVFKAGFTTGGTDILNQIVSKYGKVSLGKSMIFTDGIIILTSLLIFDFSVFIYSIISLYIISFMTDKVILGISQSKAFYIITSHESLIKQFLNYKLGHGITILEGQGGYTGHYQKVIMCIIPTKEYFLVKEGIKKIDPEAFFLVTDAYEVSGGSSGGKNGFN